MKRQRIKRGLATLLAAVLLLGMLSGAALAEETLPKEDQTAQTGVVETVPIEEPGTVAPQPCALTEGCTLPDGHEGDCALTPPPVNDVSEQRFEISITGWENHTWQGVPCRGGERIPFRSEMELLVTLDRLLSESQTEAEHTESR